VVRHLQSVVGKQLQTQAAWQQYPGKVLHEAAVIDVDSVVVTTGRQQETAAWLLLGLPDEPPHGSAVLLHCHTTALTIHTHSMS